MNARRMREIEDGRKPTTWESIECTATLLVALAFCAGFWACVCVTAWRAWR